VTRIEYRASLGVPALEECVVRATATPRTLAVGQMIVKALGELTIVRIK
jgi:hypothetical protein